MLVRKEIEFRAITAIGPGAEYLYSYAAELSTQAVVAEEEKKNSKAKLRETPLLPMG